VPHVPQDLRVVGLLALMAGGMSAARAEFTPTLTVRHERTYGKFRQGPLPRPDSVTFDPRRSELYVATPQNHQVVILNQNLAPLFRFEHQVRDGRGNAMPGEPGSALADDRGQILITDRLSALIDVTDFRGRPLRSIDVAPWIDAESPVHPGRMDRDSAGKLYVVEETTQTVLVLSPEGKLLRQVGADGPPPEGIRMLVDVAVGADGAICLLDGTAEPAIRVFDSDGKYLSGFGEHADKPEGLHMPAGVSVDSAGRIWAADTVAHEVKAFTRDGTVLAIVGGMGTADGRFYFPSDVACGADGALYVTERGGDRIQAFRVETVQEAQAGAAP